MMNNKTLSKLTYIMAPHHHVEARMQQSKTIANMEKHEQEEPTKTITTKTITTKTIATKTITNMTGSQPPMGTTQENKNKNYEMFGGGVMLEECGTN